MDLPAEEGGERRYAAGDKGGDVLHQIQLEQAFVRWCGEMISVNRRKVILIASPQLTEHRDVPPGSHGKVQNGAYGR
ncbi:hypothetical protein [Acidicapsa ligni]|uniref:hypothetical protein n=1 Tax=Acidicapsa ligni TaxID=542300 RepID=UPI0021DF4D9C|nr:hypothetical protein [Acidicapsa ligni]